jgi:uncharacterized RDD family membrane protein YckC
MSSALALSSCSLCGGRFADSDLARFGDSTVCADCKPLFVQRVRQGMVGTSAPEMHYAGFWIRGIAWAIDFAIVEGFFLAVFLVFAVVKQGRTPQQIASSVWMVFALAEIFRFAWHAGFVALCGATPGKMVAGLKIVRPNGSAVSASQAVGRFFATIISGIPLGIGYIVAAWTPQHHALHDAICGTRVIRTR